MKRLMLLSVLSCLPLCAADARMTPEERTKVLNWLEQSRTEFLSAIDGVTERQWRWKPLHTMRHDRQIAEVKGTAAYPQ